MASTAYFKSRTAAGVTLAFAAAVATLTPPRRARRIANSVLLAALVTFGVLWWYANAMAFGYVTDALVDGNHSIAAIKTMLGDQIIVRALGADTFAVGNLVMATGATEARPMIPNYVGIAHLPDYPMAYTSDMFDALITQSSVTGLVFVSAILTVLAGFSLRLAAAVVCAAISAGLTFMGLHLLIAKAILAVPTTAIEPAILLVAFAGLAVGFKATIGDRLKAWERIGGVALSALFAFVMWDTGVMPQEALAAMPVAALVFPTLPVLTAAALIILTALALPTWSAIPLTLVLLILNGVFRALLTILRKSAGGKSPSKSRARQSVTPDVDGFIPLERLAEVS